MLRSFFRAREGIDMPEEEKKANRLWRVRPIMESFRQCCLKVSRAPELSVDEMMIPFQGRMPSRQYLLLKPNPFGMKVFVLANPNGVILDFHAYTGEGTFRHLAQQVTDTDIGASAVITLLNNVPVGSSLSFDRYFTSEALLDYLLEHNISGTGTVIKSRFPRGNTFKEDSAIKKAVVHSRFLKEIIKKCAPQNGLTTSPSSFSQLRMLQRQWIQSRGGARKIETTLMCAVHQL